MFMLAKLHRNAARGPSPRAFGHCKLSIQLLMHSTAWRLQDRHSRRLSAADEHTRRPGVRVASRVAQWANRSQYGCPRWSWRTCSAACCCCTVWKRCLAQSARTGSECARCCGTASAWMTGPRRPMRAQTWRGAARRRRGPSWPRASGGAEIAWWAWPPQLAMEVCV